MYRFKGKMQNGQGFKGSAPAAKNFVEANDSALDTVKENLSTDAGKVVDFRVWFEDAIESFQMQKRRKSNDGVAATPDAAKIAKR